MLRIRIPLEDDNWDEASEEFVSSKVFVLDLEHSLVSLSKWEQKFEKPFLGVGEKTDDEIMEYICCMILNPDFPPEVISKLLQDQKHMDNINEYINAKSTATQILDYGSRRSGPEVITSELIYYWMIAFNVPFECQYWHLNRLFMLIRVCDEKNKKPRKIPMAEMLAQRRALNEQRRAKYNSSG